MNTSLHILHIVDDYGNVIPPCNLSTNSYMNRYNFFHNALVLGTAKWTEASDENGLPHLLPTGYKESK